MGLTVVLLTLGGALLAPSAQSSTSASAALAAACYGCHVLTTDTGADRPDQGLPSLAGQTAQAIERALLDYRSDRRQGTLMNRIAKGYTTAEITVLAQQLGTEPPR